MVSKHAQARKHLDSRFAWMRPADRFAKPLGGWIRAIRQSLGMSAEQLAKRMGVSQPRVIALEHAEADGNVTLKTLRRVAEALDCTLIYVLVPKRPLERTVRDRALKVAADRLPAVEHTMQLEEQGLPSDTRRDQLRLSAETLLEQAPRLLWKER